MPDLFRIGASSLLTDLERQLYHYITVTTRRAIICRWDKAISSKPRERRKNQEHCELRVSGGRTWSNL